ncbi:MAG TPA: serine/threonine-protein kinase [Planctomycetota bacterium]|nr:serine/threonine-protein kinase [Planctomycetota bacterium]
MEEAATVRRDPRAALHWLMRLREAQDGLEAARRKANPKSFGNRVLRHFAFVLGFLLCLILGILVLAILGVDVKNVKNNRAYDTGMTVVSFVSLAGGVVIAMLWVRRRAAQHRSKVPELEAQLQREADEFAASFPDVVRDLFRAKDDLLLPGPVLEAIAFLQRQGPLTSPPASALAAGPGAARAQEPCAGQMVGGCRLVRKLGQGGMGAVYQAHHVGLDIPVAVKILPPEFVQRSADAVDRFLGEARAAARLKHPNIVGVYNVGCEAGIYFIVMELVEGGSLHDLIRAAGQIGIRRAVELAGQICQGLQCAHDNGFVHRDIKPSNILLDGGGVARIADLGLAKRMGGDFGMTQSGMTLGTPYYLSPEQAADAKRVDHRTDIYSLGCMLYEMVCGKVPYEGDTLARILLAHAQAPVPDPRAANPAVSDRLARLIMRMMAKEPDGRPASAREVLAELQRGAG